MDEENKDQKPKEEKPGEEDPAKGGEGKDTDSDDAAKIVADIKKSYEAKMQEALAKKQKEIEARDEIIHQLLSDDQPKQPSIVDSINAKRAMQQKW